MSQCEIEPTCAHHAYRDLGLLWIAAKIEQRWWILEYDIIEMHSAQIYSGAYGGERRLHQEGEDG